MRRFRLLILAVLTLFAFARSSFAQPSTVPENDPLYMRVVAMPYPPEAQILDGAGHRHSAYELYVTNFGKTPLKITKLEVNGKDDEKIVATQSASGKQLAAMFVPVGGDATKPNDPRLKPGETGVFFIFADWLPERGRSRHVRYRDYDRAARRAQRLRNDSRRRARSKLGRSDRDSVSAARKKLARRQRPFQYLGASPRDAAE